MFDLTREELHVLRPLTTPAKVQDFLDRIPMNFEKRGETCHSPRSVLQKKTAHCMEGAMLAALALRLHGHAPLVMDLKASKDDLDHVVAVFKVGKFYGAISKTNHAVLRYREPIYRDIRELALSYFHEYTTKKGVKSLRSYSRLVDLSRFDTKGWMTDEDDVFYVPDYIDSVKHFSILTPSQMRMLRRADRVEREAGNILEWKR